MGKPNKHGVDKDGFIIEDGFFGDVYPTPKIRNKKKSVTDDRKKTSVSEQREWILPCNTEYYDLDNALRNLKRIDWRQTKQLKNAKVGDIVYIYCKNKKDGAICYKGAILAVNKMENIIDDSKYSSDGSVSEGPCIEVAMFTEYDLPDVITYARLKEHGLLSRLQGPTVINGSVTDYLHECDELQRKINWSSGFFVDIPDTILYPFPIKINDNLNGKTENIQIALDDTHNAEEKEKHAQSLTLDELKRIAKGQQTKKPKQITATVTQAVRDPYIAEYAKRRAKGICQLCGKKAPFKRPDGEPYLESHHIQWLSKGGADSIGNTVALCPNCHKKMHVVNYEKDINKLLAANMKLL